VTSALETEREITLGAGTLELVVLGFRGQPADPTGRLIAAVYDPRDHVHALASGFGNPLSLLVPAGRYDVRIEYGVGLSPPSGGATVAWLRGVEVRAGQATAQTFDLQLGELKLDILEAAGRPAEAANLVFYLTPVGDPATRSATVALLNTATLQLAPGSYEVIADYAGTGLLRAGPVATVQVKEGESLAQSIDLKLARLRVEVYDAPGRLSAVAASAWAYPAGTRADSFAAVYGQNPLELIVRAESAYDVVVRLDGKELVLEGVALGEGATQVRQVQAGDFK
jgi:hypothetical protein